MLGDLDNQKISPNKSKKGILGGLFSKFSKKSKEEKSGKKSKKRVKNANTFTARNDPGLSANFVDGSYVSEHSQSGVDRSSKSRNRSGSFSGMGSSRVRDYQPIVPSNSELAADV